MKKKINALTEVLSSSLNIHPKDIEITIDEESGLISYSIKSDDLSSAEEIQFALTRDETFEEVKENLNEIIPNSELENMDVSDDVQLIVEFSINADDADAHLVQASDQIASYFEKEHGFTNVEATSQYITKAPSFVPSTVPTTSIPTVAPSITGSVALISSSKSNVTSSLSSSEMNNIIDSITEAYGVDEEDVEILIEYSSSGTIDIDIPKDLIENNETLVEFLQLLEEELASDLGIHVKDLELFYNETSGEIEYILISSNFTEIEELLMELEKDDFVSQLNNTISENYPGVSIDSFEQNEEKGIEVEISVTVDTTDASENLKKANEIIEEKLIEELGFEEADSKTMFITSMPTAFPTRIPTSRTNNNNANIKTKYYWCNYKH